MGDVALASWLKTGFAKLLRDRRGNIGLAFALVVAPLLLLVGVSVDFVRAYNVRARMQADLDAALLTAVKSVDDLDEARIRVKLKTWFAAQTELSSNKYSLVDSSIIVNKVDRTIKAVASGNLPTTLMAVGGVQKLNVAVASAVAGPESSYLDVYLVLDKSASMMLAATKAGQNTLKKQTKNCVFACHEVEGGPYTYNGVSYKTNYDLAEAMGVQLRADVSVRAATQVIDLMKSADPSQSHLRVGLYSIGSVATQVLAPTFSTGIAKSVLADDSKGLTSASSEPTSRFNTSLAALTTFIGKAGDGVVSTEPRKLVLILTDGVQSERPWVMSGNKDKVTPLNPDWCSAMKKNQVTLGVLYTEYLPMTFDSGYKRTVGDTIASSEFESTWGGRIRSGVGNKTTRQQYIPYALTDCASSPDLFLSASEPADIEAGLSTLFQKYLTNVRLTQ